MTYSPGSSKPIVAEKAPSPSVAGGAFTEASSDDVSTTSTSRGASASKPHPSRVKESPTSMVPPLGLSVLGSQISVPCVGSSSSEGGDRKSTRLNSSHVAISYAVFCLKKKKTNNGNKQM